MNEIIFYLSEIWDVSYGQNYPVLMHPCIVNRQRVNHKEY